MTGVISGDVTKSLAYCLIDANTSVEVTPRFRYDPTEGVSFDLYFQQDISNLLFTPKPPVTITTGSVSVPEMVKNLKVKLIEISFDSEACESEETSEVLSNAFVVVNSTKDFLNYYTEGVPTIVLANPKPRIIKRHSGHPELLYVLTSGPSTIRVERTYYSASNQTLADDENEYETTDYVTMIDVMPSILPITYRKIFVSITLVGVTHRPLEYMIDVLPPCNKSCQVAYMASKGGYSTLSGKITLVEVSNSSEIIYRNPESGLGGNMTANKKSFKELDVTIPFIITNETDILVYEDFIASGHYYLKVKGSDGTYRQISCQASNFSLDNIRGIVKCRLRYYLPYDQPNYYL